MKEDVMKRVDELIARSTRPDGVETFSVSRKYDSLSEIIKTQEQADLLMKMLKDLKNKQ